MPTLQLSLMYARGQLQMKMVKNSSGFAPQKKRKKSVSLSKPTPEEKRIAEQCLQSTDVSVCSICFQVDAGGDDKIVNWTHCQCSLWYHCLCVGVETLSLVQFVVIKNNFNLYYCTCTSTCNIC